MFFCNKYARRNIGMDEQIFAIEAAILNEWYKETFEAASLCYLPKPRVCTNRSYLEGNDKWKQVVVYVVITHVGQNQVFVYQRDGGDERLSGKSSIGIGGHVSLDDIVFAMPLAGIIIKAAERELSEEIKFDYRGPMQIVGVINDNSDPVGRDHIGFVVATEALGAWEIMEPDSFVLTNCGWYDINNLPNREYENWSQILIQEFLGKLYVQK